MTSPAKVFSIRSKESELLHSPFYPADVREGEPIGARLLVRGELAPPRALRVWRMSPLGVELLLGEGDEDLVAGKEVSLSLRLGRGESHFDGLIVQARYQDGPNSLLGIRWHQPAATGEAPPEDRRYARRWLCGEDFMPTGIAPNPLRFNDFVHFRVRDISKSGMQLLTSLRNKLLVPGMLLESTISFPMIGHIQARIRLMNGRIVTEDGKDYLSLGVKFEDGDARLRQVTGQYLIQFGPPTSLEELRKAGLSVQSTERAIEFSFVKTKEEYQQVLELRRLAYVSAGKLPEATRAEEMGDRFDARARILIGRYRGQIIGSLRLMFHGPTDELEHEQYMRIPGDFPRKDETVEITRVCTHPDYRGSDLFLGLCKHLVVSLLQANRRWIIGSATPKLLPLYLKLGFKPTPFTYRHMALGGDEHVVFLGDVYGAVLKGVGIGPLAWNALFSDVWDYVDARALIAHDPVAQLRIGLYRLFLPFTQLMLRRMNRPRARRVKR